MKKIFFYSFLLSSSLLFIQCKDDKETPTPTTSTPQTKMDIVKLNVADNKFTLTKASKDSVYSMVFASELKGVENGQQAYAFVVQPESDNPALEFFFNAKPVDGTYSVKSLLSALTNGIPSNGVAVTLIDGNDGYNSIQDNGTLTVSHTDTQLIITVTNLDLTLSGKGTQTLNGTINFPQ